MKIFHIVLMAAALSVNAAAEDTPHPRSDRNHFLLGGFAPTSSTTIRLDLLGGAIGTELNLEDDLGLKDRDFSGYVGYARRLGQTGKHIVEIEHFSIQRNGGTILAGDITIEGEVFPVGATVTSDFDTTVTRIGYGWEFYRREHATMGFQFGLHVTDIKIGVDDIVGTGGGVYIDAVVESVSAQLPVIGFTGTWQFKPRWLLAGRYQLFRLEFDDFDGRMDHIRATVEREAWKHFAFGFGYDFFGIDIDAGDNEVFWKIDWNYGGPTFYVRAHF